MLKHSGKSIKEGWFLEYVEISCAKLKQTWKFVCNQWLCKNRPPEYKCSALLVSNDILNAFNQTHHNSVGKLI